MIVGMGGSQTINEPAPITYMEMASWAQMTGRSPSPWEARQLGIIDSHYLATANKQQGQARQGQDIGEYCQNKDLEKCRQQFGERLEQVCSTCPE